MIAGSAHQENLLRQRAILLRHFAYSVKKVHTLQQLVHPLKTFAFSVLLFKLQSQEAHLFQTVKMNAHPGRLVRLNLVLHAKHPSSSPVMETRHAWHARLILTAKREAHIVIVMLGTRVPTVGLAYRVQPENIKI